MRDHLGREMKVGDFIVYGSALGRCAALASGYIVDLYEETTQLPDWRGEKKFKTDYKIKVKRNTTAGTWGNNIHQKHSTLKFPSRCVVTDPTGIDFEELQKRESLWD